MTRSTKVTALEIHACAMHYFNTVAETVHPPPMGFVRSALRMALELRWVCTCIFRVWRGREFPLRDAPFPVVASLAQCNTGDSIELLTIKTFALEEVQARMTMFENLLDELISAFETDRKNHG